MMIFLWRRRRKRRRHSTWMTSVLHCRYICCFW